MGSRQVHALKSIIHRKQAGKIIWTSAEEVLTQADEITPSILSFTQTWVADRFMHSRALFTRKWAGKSIWIPVGKVPTVSR